jgi:tetratricopeptide (TPR) repeat protein
VDNSLVQAENRGGEPRFRLLETIREYALERLREGADWRQAHDRHAAYFLALAEPAAAELQDRGQLGWLDRLETEHDNLWAAMSWLVDQDQLEPAVALFWVTWRFWWLHGHPAELAGLGEKIVAASERLPPFQRAMALTGTGFMFMANGDQARAQILFEQSLPLYLQVGEKLGVTLKATVLGVLGRLSALRHDFVGASELLAQSQAVLNEVGSDELSGYERLQHLLTIALVSNFLGQIRLSQNDHEHATQLFTEGLSAARRAPDRISILISLYDLALSSQARGDLDGAAGLLKEGLSLAAEAGDDTSAAYYLEELAAVARQQDNLQRAVRLLTAARSLLESRGSGWLHAFVPRAPNDDKVLDTLRSAMGNAAFDEAWAWRQSAGDRRALEFALEKPTPLLPSPQDPPRASDIGAPG